MCGFKGPVNGRETLQAQFHGGGDAVGAAEHGVSCLVEVRACNKDEDESPTHRQLLCCSWNGGSQSKASQQERVFMSSPPENSGRAILLRPPTRRKHCVIIGPTVTAATRVGFLSKTSSQIPPRGALLCLGGGEGRWLVGDPSSRH